MPMRHGIPGGILWRGADVSRYNRGSGSRMCAHVDLDGGVCV